MAPIIGKGVREKKGSGGERGEGNRERFGRGGAVERSVSGKK